MNSDYRGMFDADYLGVWDVAERDHTFEITRVMVGELSGGDGRKTRKPIVYFREVEKGLALNKTNARTIAALYGNDTRGWAGQRITLFATTTTFGRETVECIRVRPDVPGRRPPAPRPAPVETSPFAISEDDDVDAA